MNQALIEHYRCPKSLVNFIPQGSVTDALGYFQFGTDVICYGHSTSGVSGAFTTNGLPEAFEPAKIRDASVLITFNPDEIAANLRFERYPADTRRAAADWSVRTFAHDLYYTLRPFIPTDLRQSIQRFYLRGWDQIPFPRWPVDTTVERLFERLLTLCMKAQHIDRIPFIWFWPDGLASCAIVTHDVETSSGRDYCECVMDMDDSVGIKASFQLVPEERYEVSNEFIKSIRNRGFEINIQDLNHDGRLFRKREEFLSRAAKINHYARVFRAHGFRAAILYRNLQWYDQLEFEYDMSVPNVGHLEPQRGGCCTVFPYFIGNIVELPLTTTQDYSLFTILKTHSIELWKTQMELIMARHGLISLIVHPDYVASTACRHTFCDLLSYLAQLRSERSVWIARPGEVNQWWRQRSRMKLVCKHDTWSVEGAGSERARVAWAILDGDAIEYEI